HTVNRGRRSASLSDGFDQLEKSGEAYSDRLGVPDLDTVSRHETGDCPEHRDSVVAVRAHAAAGRPSRDAAHVETVVPRADAHAKRTERGRHGFDAVTLLHAQLAGAVDPAFAAGKGSGESEQRQLVHEERNFFGPDLGADELG